MLELHLPVTDEAPAQARRAIAALECDEQSMDKLALLVSEVVTNSILHSGAGEDDVIRLRAELRDGLARVRVCDPGSRRVAVRPPDDAPGGWGLMLVDEIADRWGVERNHHTCVWFEVAAGSPGA